MQNIKKKRYKTITCPVCGELVFPGPNTDDPYSVDSYLNGGDKCWVCGWILDFKQLADFDLKKGYNEMSVNEHREWFKAKRKENPKYTFLDDNICDPEPHPCPICGEFTFADIECFDICPVCGWQDDGELYDPGANETTAEEAIRLFKEHRKENPYYFWAPSDPVCRKIRREMKKKESKK